MLDDKRGDLTLRARKTPLTNEQTSSERRRWARQICTGEKCDPPGLREKAIHARRSKFLKEGAGTQCWGWREKGFVKGSDRKTKGRRGYCVEETRGGRLRSRNNPTKEGR